MTNSDDKQKFMEIACKLGKNPGHRVDSISLFEQIGWQSCKSDDMSKFRDIANELQNDGYIRPNQLLTSSGSQTDETLSWDFFWVTQSGLDKWCGTTADNNKAD